jgi:hypothetical protein
MRIAIFDADGAKHGPTRNRIHARRAITLGNAVATFRRKIAFSDELGAALQPELRWPELRVSAPASRVCGEAGISVSSMRQRESVPYVNEVVGEHA